MYQPIPVSTGTFLWKKSGAPGMSDINKPKKWADQPLTPYLIRASETRSRSASVPALILAFRDCRASTDRRTWIRRRYSCFCAGLPACRIARSRPGLGRHETSASQSAALMCHNRASSTALGSAICTLPVPMTLMAFRFFAPKTAPKPPMRALTPLPVMRAASRDLASPAGPMQTICGRAVV